MTFHHLAVDAVRVAIVLAVALLAVRLLRRASSALRRLVLASALASALVLPFVSAVAPSWRFSAENRGASVVAKLVAEPSSDAPTVALVADAPENAPRRSRAVDLATWIALAWAAGAVVVAARVVLGMRAARRIVARSSAVSDAWATAIAHATRATGATAPIRETSELAAPAVVGPLAPVVLVPLGSDAWTEERKRAVLVHELAHVAHADGLAQLAGQLACALHWFDPLAWVALRWLRIERELAADDVVVASGMRASRYAEDLLAIAGAGPAPHATPASVLGMADGGQLAARVVAIVAPDRVRAPVSRRMRVLVGALSTALLVAGACATPETRPAARNGDAATAAAPGTDARIQTIADEELDAAVRKWNALAGAVVVLDPTTGDVLANAGVAHGTTADVARWSVPPGSTYKAVAIAAALEEGVVRPSDGFDCAPRMYGDRGPLHDASPNGTLSLGEIVARSSNVGVSRIFDRLGSARFDGWTRRFHFEPSATDDPLRGALVAIGVGAKATPLQIASLYATIANDGVYLAPSSTPRDPASGERILRADTARSVVALLRGVVDGEHGTGANARVEGVAVAGKTGTAEWDEDGATHTWASFVGIVPADRPRLVILAGLETTGADATGGAAAAPVFAKVAARALR